MAVIADETDDVGEQVLAVVSFGYGVGESVDG